MFVSLHRSHVIAASIAVALSSTAIQAPLHAQEARLFQNSWFWGLHGGSTNIGTTAQSASGAGTLGAEWMITRTHGGLYVAYDQASFTRNASISDPAATNGTRAVKIHDMRSVSIAAMAFPFQPSRFRPYAGLGYEINILADATPQPDVPTTAGATPAPVSQDVLNRTEDARSRSTVFFLGGAQWQVRRTALFGQLSLTPSDSKFLVNKPIYSITAGVRYNFGSSIDR